MRNTNGSGRCVCEQDTVSIHVIEVSNLVLEFAIGILHLLPHAVPAGMGEIELKPPGISGVEVAEEQHAWCQVVRGCVCERRIR